VIRVAAPASSANLGPGFDCAAAALELWNELQVAPGEEGEVSITLEGEGAEELPRGPEHLALRAFALIAPPEGHRFHFVNRIPLERGLGSSAASVAVGLVAACAVSRRELGPDQLLELGLPLEGHADNLAAALRGGVCLSWLQGERLRSVRIADSLPLDAVVVLPAERTNTHQSRARLPEFLRHEEAQAAAAAAALLGAAIVAADPELLGEALGADRLHEPFRGEDAPLLGLLRAELPQGALAVTLSGSGPSVVVWSLPRASEQVAAELGARFPDARVPALRVAAEGARTITAIEEGAAR
jgi:homoserine kinase